MNEELQYRGIIIKLYYSPTFSTGGKPVTSKRYECMLNGETVRGDWEELVKQIDLAASEDDDPASQSTDGA